MNDSGTVDQKTDAGSAPAPIPPPPGPPPPPGSVTSAGGTVPHLYFAVVGDTRPSGIDGTANYPTAVISRIYADLEAMNPKPQFVVTTGDYMFASTSGGQASPQLNLYQQASRQFTGGPIFSAMGNHECTGATASNCATQTTSNYQAFLNALVMPLGQSRPYYKIPFQGTDGSWNAKLLVVACNAWDATQESWLQGELASPTTFTFLVRHEPRSVPGAPCVTPMDSMLTSATYNLLIVGHSHTFRFDPDKQLVVGNGGAPILGQSVPYGYATVEQNTTGGGFTVKQYDATTAAPIATFQAP